MQLREIYERLNDAVVLCHLHLHQTQGLSFISVTVSSFAWQPQNFHSCCGSLCVSHADSAHNFRDIYQNTPLFIH